MKALVVCVASFLTCSAVFAGGYDPADAAQVEAWELTGACAYLVGIGLHEGIDECIEHYKGQTIVDNPDPVGNRTRTLVEDINPLNRRCRQVRSVFDLEDGCPPDTGAEVIDMYRYDRGSNTLFVLPWTACDDASDCFDTISDSCRRHGYGTSFIQFTPDPDRSKGERECVGKCNNAGQLQIEVNCDIPQVRPTPPDDVANPYMLLEAP